MLQKKMYIHLESRLAIKGRKLMEVTQYLTNLQVVKDVKWNGVKKAKAGVTGETIESLNLFNERLRFHS